MKTLGFLDIDHARFRSAGTPYKIYAELLDATTHDQFYDVLSLPYVTYAALMPDAHAGYSMPIGGVCASKEVVVPQFVGFDIGCGMCAYQTDFTKKEVQLHASKLFSRITERIPLGFNRHTSDQPFECDLPRTPFADHLLRTVGVRQLGTLGGGNHFIEVGYGKDDRVWIVIHSGSRGFGHKIASHYMYHAYLTHNPQEQKLEKLLAEWDERNIKFKEHNPDEYAKCRVRLESKLAAELDKKIDLGNLPGIWGLDARSELGQAYIIDQRFALNFALENRKRMIGVIHDTFNETLGSTFTFASEDEARFINRNHNHVEYDEKRGEWIHRKGATQADTGMTGVIPGNMRDGSFVVKGKGNPASLNSSSHGAGRVMSRKKAKGAVTMEAFQDAMQGITGTVDINTLDESPFAYKDIFEVMRLQHDLVDIVEHIKVLINVKDSTPSRY